LDGSPSEDISPQGHIMLVDAPRRFTRRHHLFGASRAIAALALLVVAGHPRKALAEKARKEDLAYQDQPMGDQRCALCRQFSPSAAGKGTCAVVEGEVSANGWCAAYSPNGSE
jgi:hypothetical protein